MSRMIHDIPLHLTPLDLNQLGDMPAGRLTKGLPSGASATSANVKQFGWNVLRGDLPFPLLVLKDSVLEHNLRAMAEWCDRNGLLLAPHGKTTMCPQIFARQVEHRAWAITVATVKQAEVCLRFGVTRILIANQVAGIANIKSLAELINDLSKPEIYCLIDSIDGVRQLAAGLERFGAARPANVLVEWGHNGWRTGVRSLEQGMEVLAVASGFPKYLNLAGVEAFEGLASSPDGATAEGLIVDDFLNGLSNLGRLLRERMPDGEKPLLSAGGSAYLDRVLKLAQATAGDFHFVVRSGCYATHDHLHYQHKQEGWISRSAASVDLPEFSPALELWGCVQSAPQADRAFLNFGKRDCSYDMELPLPLLAVSEGRPIGEARRLQSSRITSLNDQHAYLDFSAPDHFKVGELVCCGISHPCTSFDKWRVIPVVNDDYDVIDLYHTFF
ncbi:MAG: hypothetical protein IPO77_17780 [Acidobacteria bacterium]|nr:hypothetical protein [Acidobacteriota bacterium]